jgi:hypothetical protein
MNEKQYFLTKKNDGWMDFIDQDGVSHDCPEEWFWIAILGGCGCGSSEEFANKAVELLTYFSSDDKDYHTLDNFTELMAHWFHGADLIEHGSNIRGSWLTDKGKQILGIINELKQPCTEQTRRDLMANVDEADLIPCPWCQRQYCVCPDDEIVDSEE